MKSLNAKTSNAFYHKAERLESKLSAKSVEKRNNVEILSALSGPVTEHDVEDRLTASKISISAFKSTSSNLVQPLLHPVNIQRLNSSDDNSLQRQ